MLQEIFKCYPNLFRELTSHKVCFVGFFPTPTPLLLKQSVGRISLLEVLSCTSRSDSVVLSRQGSQVIEILLLKRGSIEL